MAVRIQKDVNCHYIRNTLVYSVKNVHYIKKKKRNILKNTMIYDVNGGNTSP